MATTKDYSGALFRNTREGAGPNAPLYTGDLLIDGVRYRLAGWVKEGARGKFLSLSVKPDEERPAANGGKPQAKTAADDSIAF